MTIGVLSEYVQLVRPERPEYDTVVASGLVHEVIQEHVVPYKQIRLATACGGYMDVPRDFPWRHDDPFVTCFFCLSGPVRDVFFLFIR